MSETIPLTIFHTNDMHGHLAEMARLSNLARRQRQEAEARGRHVLFWDAGDAADRRVRIFSITKGKTLGPIMNAMGYDLQVMGNDLSLPYGPHCLEQVAKRANFPILAANCRDGEGPLLPGLHECVVFSLPAGLKLGVIGLTAPWGDLYTMFGLHFPDVVGVARRLVAELQGQGVQVIALLSHLGLEDDKKLLDEVPGIHFLIGGHSHSQLMQGEWYSGVLIAQTGDYARFLGRLDLELEPGTGKIVAASAGLIEVPDGEAPDPLVTEAIAAAENETQAIMNQPVAVLEGPLDLEHFQECSFGNLAADALRQRMGGEVALLVTGQIHHGLPAGTLTVGALDGACFSSANPGLTEVRGEQIWAALEGGLDEEFSRQEVKGFRGTPLGAFQVSGMQVHYNPHAPLGARLRQVLVQTGAGFEPLDPQRLYRLAHTDAETMPMVPLALDEGQASKYEVPTILPEVLRDYLAQNSPVTPPELDRWRVVEDDV